MRRNGLFNIFLSLTLIGCLFVSCPEDIKQTKIGFHIEGDNLLDAKGNVFIIRGINYPHQWYPTRYKTSIPHIAATGANTIRIVLGCGKQWGPTPNNQVKDLIDVCKNNKLIAILEVHDCTGYNDNQAAATLEKAVNYWIGLKEILSGEEAYVIINLANEPFGNNLTYSRWESDHVNAIKSMRNAGFKHTLMVDAGNWGQDWQNVMLNKAQQVFNADELKNTVFSVHMYEVYDSDEKVNNYLTTFRNRYNFPLVVGEFGHAHGVSGSQDVAEDAIMARCVQYGIGYLGWSWCGNSTDYQYLDLVTNWDPTQLTSWGNTLIKGSNGIKNTSNICSVFKK